ncbi:hypothetical protein E1289_14580 [Actinomadura sp. 6K520]|nr:hypothetical protein E1289_14580 [Actinomadura sp. 6K520]
MCSRTTSTPRCSRAAAASHPTTHGGAKPHGHAERLGPLIRQALDPGKLCSSNPLCSEHDPRNHGRLYGGPVRAFRRPKPRPPLPSTDAPRHRPARPSPLIIRLRWPRSVLWTELVRAP